MPQKAGRAGVSDSGYFRGSRKGYLRYAIAGSQGVKDLEAPALLGASDRRLSVRIYGWQAPPGGRKRSHSLDSTVPP